MFHEYAAHRLLIGRMITLALDLLDSGSTRTWQLAEELSTIQPVDSMSDYIQAPG